MKKLSTNIGFLSLLALLIFSLSSCNRGKNAAIAEDLPPGTHAVSIIEVIQTSNYTYLQVFENNVKYWIAVASREAKAGDVLYFTDGMEMKNFHSKELDRTFPSIYFVQDPSETLDRSDKSMKSSGKVQMKKFNDISVEPATGGISIADLYKNKDNYNEKPARIRGIVVKFNKNIMGKNWVHIQDGTSADDNFDLTITTMDEVSEGNIVTFEGTIRLNKDFGAGYAYDVIMEDAKATEVKMEDDTSL